MLKGIIFDFDGVLFDDYEEHYDIYIRKYKNMNREVHRKAFEGNIIESKEKLLVKDNSVDIKKELKELLFKKGIYKNVLDILKKLKKKYKLFIITSTWEENILEYLKKEKLSNLFDEILGLNSGKFKKDKFEVLINKYKFSRGEVVFITDTLGDILESNNIGIKSIGVDFGYHERERLEKGIPYKIVSNFDELYKEVLKIN